jgi:hypothetical protein
VSVLWEASGSEGAEDFNNMRILGRTAGFLKVSDQAGLNDFLAARTSRFSSVTPMNY